MSTSENSLKKGEKEEIIRKYFNAWINKTPDVLPEIFSEEIVYSECYGPEYNGLNQIMLWFCDWNENGCVLEWPIKSFIHDKNHLVVEWYFKCIFKGETGGFDGVSLVTFDDKGKISVLKEFQSKSEHVYPYKDGDHNDLLRGSNFK